MMSAFGIDRTLIEFVVPAEVPLEGRPEDIL